MANSNTGHADADYRVIFDTANDAIFIHDAATAKRLVESHQGRISVECPPGGGTVFTIELPFSRGQ